MANLGSAFFACLGDSLKIFALPVTTIQRASERGLSVASSLVVLVLLTLVGVIIRAVISLAPGGLSQPFDAVGLALDGVSSFLFFLISLLVLFALIVVLGGKTDFSRLFATKLSLAAAVVGAFAIALIGKLIIGLLFLGAQDGVGGGLIVLGENFGLIAIGLILAVYTIIVARFGGQLSWLLAFIAGVLHFVLMAAILTAYQVLVLQNQFNALEQMLQN